MKEVLQKADVIKYAEPLIYKFILKYAPDIPLEHKKEIEQTAYLRLLEAFDGIEPDRGWKSFTYNHCRGTVLDYLKFGNGFAEQKWSIRKDEGPNARHRNKIKDRVFLSDAAGEDIDIEIALGANGIFSEQANHAIILNWPLISRMAFADEALHAFARHIRGDEMRDIARCFGVSMSKIGNLIAGFLSRFDDPALADDRWFLQTCYAFGLCGTLGIPNVDQSSVCGFPVGWNLKPLDLDSDEEFPLDEEFQLSFFDVG